MNTTSGKPFTSHTTLRTRTQRPDPRASGTAPRAAAHFEPLEGRRLLAAIISEDFTSGAANLTAVDGTWAVASGAYKATTAGTAATTHLNTRSVHTTSISGDFTLTANASVVATSSAWNDYAVIFGYKDANNYYFFSSNESNDGATSGLFKVVNGTSTQLADVAGGITAGTTYQLQVERAGATISAYRNGVLVASASDSTFLSGRVGFGSKGDQGVFDELTVKQSTPPPPPGPSGTPVISEDFSTGGANFTPADGTWAASDGAYRVTTAGTATTTDLNTHSLHNTAVSGDFALDVDASVVGTSSAWNDFAVLFGYQDANNYYFASFNESNDAATNGIFRVVNGTSTQLTDFSGLIAANTNYHVHVDRAGNQISVFLGGTIVGTATDGMFTSGMVGLGTKGDLATFDNLVVAGTVATTPTPTAPAAPSGLSATAAASSQVNLAWADNSSDESGFKIEQSSDGGSTWASAGTVGAGVTSYAAGGLNASTAYSFRVRAYNGAGDSADSNVATATTPSAPVTGAKPGPSNTGPTNASALRAGGSITVTTPGAVIENVDVTGTITIKANNVTIRNFRINAGGAGYAISISNGVTGTVMQDGEVTNFGEAVCYSFENYTAQRLNVHHAGKDGFKAEGNVLIEGCWVHHLGMAAGAHADGVQVSTGAHIIVRNNFFDMPVGQSGFASNSAIIIKADFGRIDDVLFEGNWANGGNFTVYSRAGTSYPAPTNVRILNNRFGRDYQYGLYSIDGTVTVSGNVWDDTGAPANSN